MDELQKLKDTLNKSVEHESYLKDKLVQIAGEIGVECVQQKQLVEQIFQRQKAMFSGDTLTNQWDTINNQLDMIRKQCDAFNDQ